MFVNYILLGVSLILLLLGYYLPIAFEKKQPFVNLLGKVYLGAGAFLFIISILLLIF